MRKVAVGFSAIAIGALALAHAQAAPPQKVSLCHKTSSAKTPYVLIKVRPAVAAKHVMHHQDVMPVPAAGCRSLQALSSTRGGSRLTANLTGTAGTGTATIRLRPGQGTVCFQFTNLPSGFTFALAHIHRGSNTGPIVVPFTSTGATSGCVPAGDPTTARALVREILRNPEAFWVNLHLADGTVVLSGQLSR
jgi:hypothetical protein